MELTSAFEKIRPYREEEIPAAISRISSDPGFAGVLGWLFPDRSAQAITGILHSISGVKDFQEKLMHPALKSILRKTTRSFTVSGVDNLTSGQYYLFIGNHRDIVLDSALLQLALWEHGFPTTEISAGSNLFISPMLVEIGKINKMFTVLREGDGRELYQNLKVLSAYIRHVIKTGSSVWIAQRNGRTKNGDDRTEIALLKMLHASHEGDFVSGFTGLNLLPLTISYEYEPCDTLKVKEIYGSMKGEYTKEQGEDLKSVITGIMQPKGGVHLHFGKPLNPHLPGIATPGKTADQFARLAALIDQQIHSGYRLYPANYIAHDLLAQGDQCAGYYTGKEKELFMQYMNKHISDLTGDRNMLEKLFLELYANPVKNHFSQIS